MELHRVLVTCPPMLGMIDSFIYDAKKQGLELIGTNVTQTLQEDELIRLLPNFDGWIIGDDPATNKVFEAGQKGRLKAAVKWGVGVDNVDFNACSKLNIPIANTPGMFGSEVADIAVGYVVSLARHILDIDKGIRNGGWPKPRGVSLSGKKVALIGYGDIGRKISRRLQAAEMNITIYDPFIDINTVDIDVRIEEWPNKISEADFIIISCALSDSSYHMINKEAFAKMKNGVRIINVSRGGIIDEKELISAMEDGIVKSVALDVFEQEPLPVNSPLRKYKGCILGSHNASNTNEGVERTSLKAIEILGSFLQAPRQ